MVILFVTSMREFVDASRPIEHAGLVSASVAGGVDHDAFDNRTFAVLQKMRKRSSDPTSCAATLIAGNDFAPASFRAQCRYSKCMRRTDGVASRLRAPD